MLSSNATNTFWASTHRPRKTAAAIIARYAQAWYVEYFKVAIRAFRLTVSIFDVTDLIDAN